MPSFRYRALTDSGELVTRTITAASAAEGVQRIEMLGLVPIDNLTEERPTSSRFKLASLNRPRPDEITILTRDLALLLRAGVRINDALELLSSDIDVGRLRPVVNDIRAAVVGGESFAEALAHHPALFPPIYVALIGVGETSGTLDHILEMLGNERARAEALRRRLADAVRYPLFVLVAAGLVLIFFLMFVLPQFASVLRDFGAKLDPVVGGFIRLSDFLNANSTAIALALIAILSFGWLLLRRAKVRGAIMQSLSKIPLVRTVMMYHRTALFCRNLSILLGSGVNLTATLRILVDIMRTVGHGAVWTATAERIRHGAKLSDALADSGVLPAMAVRLLRLGDETGQLPVLAGRVAEFYEAKLQRSLDRVVGIAGPAAIIVISIVVGGLIVSVMTALLSVSQIVG
jgi:general secretion pathway protein F